jgi:hypothetical protein
MDQLLMRKCLFCSGMPHVAEDGYPAAALETRQEPQQNFGVDGIQHNPKPQHAIGESWRRDGAGPSRQSQNQR